MFAEADQKSLSIKKIGLIALGLFVLCGLIFGISIYSTINSTRDQGISKENLIVATYKGNQAELADTTMSITESLGVADKNAEAVNKVLMDVISTDRYTKNGTVDASKDGALINALSVAEDSPNLDKMMESYSKVQDTIVSKRTAFKNKQNLLLDNIREYKNWLDSGLVRSNVVKLLDFPSDRLTVTLSDGTTLTGKDALNKMETVLMDKSTANAFDTGVLTPTITPKD